MKTIINLINEDARKCTVSIEEDEHGKEVIVRDETNKVENKMMYATEESNQDIVDDLVLYYGYVRI